MHLGGELLGGWVNPGTHGVVMHAPEILKAHTLVCTVGKQSQLSTMYMTNSLARTHRS